MMPKRLALHLPFLTQEERDALYGSIVLSASSLRGSPTREGVIQDACPYFLSLLLVFSLSFFNLAYDDVMKVMMIVVTVVAVVPFVLSFSMPNWYLGNSQNALDQVDLAGNKVKGEPKE